MITSGTPISGDLDIMGKKQIGGDANKPELMLASTKDFMTIFLDLHLNNSVAPAWFIAPVNGIMEA